MPGEAWPPQDAAVRNVGGALAPSQLLEVPHGPGIGDPRLETLVGGLEGRQEPALQDPLAIYLAAGGDPIDGVGEDRVPARAAEDNVESPVVGEEVVVAGAAEEDVPA